MPTTNLIIVAVIAAAILIVILTQKKTPESPAPADPHLPESWEIGPIVNGENDSVWMPLHPAPHPEGMVLEFSPGREVHYVTVPVGPLVGKTRMTLAYRVEVEDGAKIVPCKFPENTPTLSLYFQRTGDTWTRDHESYRWYSGSEFPLSAGTYSVSATFSSPWVAAQSSTTSNNPNAFSAALADTARVGFVCGGGDGRGHGVTATGHAKIVILSFLVE